MLYTRYSSAPKPKAKALNRKGKGREKPGSASSIKTLADLVLGPNGAAIGASESLMNNPLVGAGGLGNASVFEWPETSDEEDEFLGKSGLKVETIDGIKFHDISGVKIFEKGILGGRL